jgi:hypothetical protein
LNSTFDVENAQIRKLIIWISNMVLELFRRSENREGEGKDKSIEE